MSDLNKLNKKEYEMKQYNGKIKIIKRLNSSVNGNPRFLIELVDMEGYVEVETKSDSAYCYNIENLDRAGCDCEILFYFTKGGKGKIENIKRIL